MTQVSHLGKSGYALGISENNVVSFQLGDSPSSRNTVDDPEFERSMSPINQHQWLNYNGYYILSRGDNNLKCEEMEFNIKKNRLHPRIIDKQVKYLYGKGLQGYYENIDDKGNPIKQWVKEPEVDAWFESWQRNGIEAGFKDLGMNICRHFYTHYDYFIRWRFTDGKQFGFRYPLAGIELIENRHCRLATDKRFNPLLDVPSSNDFKHIAFGNWGFGSPRIKFFHRFIIADLLKYTDTAISHHRQSSVGDFYGSNETYEGTKPWIEGANDSPDYINSFLRNSLSAKIHIIIPNAWLEAKRKQIKALCDENEKRKKANKALLLLDGIDIGTSYKESSLIKYVNLEIRKATEYLSGKKNQGKAFASYSFRTGANEEERWRFETIDLKYQEYINAMISVDKRVDQVMASSSGLDPSLIGIMQDGKMTNSGADIYYNILVYLMTLTPDDDKCTEPFNLCLQINFPKLYASGYRIGFFREMPSRQNEVTPSERLQNQQQ